VFEQSILLNQDASKPWKAASLSAELLVVSLAFLIPLASSDHLPVFHWKSITTRPASAPLPVEVTPTRNPGATSALTVAAAPRPIFHFHGRASENPAPTPADFSPEAPPSVSVDGASDGAGPVKALLITTPPLPPPKPVVHATASTPIRVTSTVQMAKLIRKVIPEYPRLAREARISGVVHLVGTIGKDGTIRNLQLIGGHPMLAQAAMEAVEQWVYEPTLLNGEPVEVIAPIEVNFTLGR
jgi:protein TonB